MPSKLLTPDIFIQFKLINLLNSTGATANKQGVRDCQNFCRDRILVVLRGYSVPKGESPHEATNRRLGAKRSHRLIQASPG